MTDSAPLFQAEYKTIKTSHRVSIQGMKGQQVECLPCTGELEFNLQHPV